MQLQYIVLFALGVAASPYAGWTIPVGQPDGVYGVLQHQDGKSTHELLRELQDVPKARESPRVRGTHVRRTNIGVTCAGYALTEHGDVDSAYNNLGYQCDHYGSVRKGYSYYAIAGESDFLRNHVSTACGSYSAGWGTVNENSAHYSYGYEKLSNDRQFCGMHH